ncbi:LrgB family protein [Alteromonas halophila]|uniref:LrgB family protein n=1 Tax=Alteromonas halophila TaxID=516698 RepID=A0A918JBN2_9ALTE|nr:LrgB family protein [Alteromonas halophila]GGW72646.1 hypothetical protein GCM10007391_00120 [Alteromonas halophila]
MHALFDPLVHVVQNTLSIAGLLWLGVTLFVYAVAIRIHHAARATPALHPLLLTVVIVGAALWLSNTTIAEYQRVAGLLHWLLGPATVALALPMYNQWQRIRHHGWRLVVAIAAGGVIAPLLAWLTVWVVDAPVAMQLTMLLKSITTPLAMEATRLIGGIPALAAVFVIITGIVGAMVSGAVFRLVRVDDPHAQGIALGTVGHAVGTARALQLSEQTGAMATLGLCVNGIMTALVVPLLFA